MNAFTSLLVDVSAFLVHLFGGRAIAQQKLLRNPLTGFQITVEDTCNASNVVILLCSAVLAFPAAWRQKAKGHLYVWEGVMMVLTMVVFWMWVQASAKQSTGTR